MLKPLTPVMGQAELQRPHCSQNRNISMALKRSANLGLPLIGCCLNMMPDSCSLPDT
jgi:hypothetical protein